MSESYVTRDIPVKQSTCQECGATIVFKTCPKKFCAGCAAKRKHAQSVAGMTRQRRKKGIAQVKGTTFICARCEGEFERSGIKRRFCDTCAPIVTLDRARERSWHKSRDRGAPLLGTEKVCVHCTATFLTRGPTQIYCDICKVLYRKSKLPFQRVANSIKAKEKRAAERLINPAPPPNSTPRNCVCSKCQDPYVTTARFTKYCPTCAEEVGRDLKNHRQRIRQRRLAETCAMFNLNHRMRHGISQSLGKGIKNGRSWRSLVGYTANELYRHLERQFLRGMTWEKRGEWHIDHIIPLSSFKFTSPDDPEFRAAWALTNLRPLWAKDNLLKNNQRLTLL